MRETGATARIVASWQVVHERRQRDAGVAGVRASNRMHEAVAVGEDRPAFPPGRIGNRVHRCSGVVSAHDHRCVLACVTGAGRCLREHSAALGITRSRFLSAREHEHGRGRTDREDSREHDDEDPERRTGGPAARAARWQSLPFRYLITKTLWPVETLPLMSFAIHLNVVVSVMWNTSPGSRGPVESHSGDDSVGFDPSVV